MRCQFWSWKTDIPIHLNLKAAQQVVYCEGTLLVAYSW
jgi:hypothetical protein